MVLRMAGTELVDHVAWWAGGRLPDAADAELVELGVLADDGNVERESLGGQNAVEGVARLATRRPARSAVSMSMESSA